ncbi:hypothetical protein [Algisphaera agarilytica]|uniref:hypothetical protein n=1 Tax=Algisphaera agarilytica TaxID=1385975 RepID=UPI001C881BAC|nr:hypothetical protein [Algisphaera agarilytica]
MSPLAAAELEPVQLTVSPDTVRSIGGITTLEREKYITIHATPGEPDITEEQRIYIEEELEAHYGRDGGVQSGQLQVTPADPANPRMPDVAFLKEAGASAIAERAAMPERYRPESMREVVLCTHPEWMMGIESNDYAEFGPKSAEAAAEFCANFLKYFYTDEDRPKYYEVFNEPFVKSKKIGTNVEEMSHQHVVTARRIKELTPDVLVGGYSAAWAEVEARNFEHWNNWQKAFMDIAGDDMDFFATHLYDGVNVKGTHAERTGSNIVAIMDLIDAYSYIKWGVAKPQMISEYGRIIKPQTDKEWPNRLKREVPVLGSFNGMLMMYLDHPDRMLKTVPYILGVGSWTYGIEGGMRSTEEAPSDFLLFRRSGDNYVTTGLELFYRFWKGIDGERRLTTVSDPDIRSHYFADGLRHTLVLHNMDTEERAVALDGFDGLDIAKVTLRRLTAENEAPLLSEQTLFGLPDEISIGVGQAAALLIDLRSPYEAERVQTETRVYASEYLKAIEAGQPIEFVFEGLPAGEGDAVLRLAIGRVPGLSLQPKVEVNGQTLEVPVDWSGGDQAGRPTFFGLIEVPVPGDLLDDAATTFTLTFPDAGGKVASAVLRVDRVTTK